MTNKTKQSKVIGSIEKLFLQELHLSSDEIRLYEVLLSYGAPMTAQQVVDKTFGFPSAVYRLFYSLEMNGLVSQVNHRPKSFVAIIPFLAFSRALELKRTELENMLIDASLLSSNDYAPAEVLVGRRALYKRYEIEVSKANKEICAHSIGIAYSEEMYNINRLAIKRGVVVRYAFQQYKPSNFHVIKKWQDIGMKMRHAPDSRGFHIMLFDNKKVIISFSNPENTEDRLSIVTENKTALDIFTKFFEELWSSYSDFKI